MVLGSGINAIYVDSLYTCSMENIPSLPVEDFVNICIKNGRQADT